MVDRCVIYFNLFFDFLYWTKKKSREEKEKVFSFDNKS
jgi:hypothetical protein